VFVLKGVTLPEPTTAKFISEMSTLLKGWEYESAGFPVHGTREVRHFTRLVLEMPTLMMS
jgi:hypothetical protein